MGAATVRAYAREGAQVFSMDLDADRGAEVAQDASANGTGDVLFEPCDLATSAAMEVMEAGIEWLGGLDVLAHVAGIERKDDPRDVTEAEIAFLLECNLWSTIQTNQLAHRHMRRLGGRIINYASGAGLAGMPNASAYSASKGGVLGWSRSIAAEWNTAGIAVIAMCPVIWTPMYEQHRERNPETVAMSDLMLKGSDADRDMAPVMVFLATPGSYGISGQYLNVTRPPGEH